MRALGIARVLVEGPDGSGRTLWVDEAYPYVMVFTGDIPAVERAGLAAPQRLQDVLPGVADRSSGSLIESSDGCPRDALAPLQLRRGRRRAS